jgi:transposase InsO family protein
VTLIYPVVPLVSDQELNVNLVCDTLGISRSAYYAWRQHRPTIHAQQDARLKPEIRQVFREHKRRYGARRIAYELTASGPPCSRRRAGRLMHEMNLVAIQPRSFKPRTTNSRHTLGYSPNLLLETSPPQGINQVWVGDITYIHVRECTFLYLALLMDLFSRRIIGWEMQDHMRELLVLAALRKAIARRQPAPKLIHHTDRGGQYAGAEYRQVLARAGMNQSMSRPDDCYDNAAMESCFGTIKMELELKRLPDRQSALREIPAYFRYYNLRRRHSALGYLSPIEFERSL